MGQLWDTRTKDAVSFIPTDFPITAIALSEAGNELFTGGIDNDIKVWDLRKKAVTYSLLGHTDTITSLQLSPDNTTLLSNAHDSTVRTWDVRPFAPADRRKLTYDGAPTGQERNLLKASWDPKGERIAAGSGDQSVAIWEARTGKLLHKLPGHRGAVNDVRFHPRDEPLCKYSLFLAISPWHFGRLHAVSCVEHQEFHCSRSTGGVLHHKHTSARRYTKIRASGGSEAQVLPDRESSSPMSLFQQRCGYKRVDQADLAFPSGHRIVRSDALGGRAGEVSSQQRNLAADPWFGTMAQSVARNKSCRRHHCTIAGAPRVTRELPPDWTRRCDVQRRGSIMDPGGSANGLENTRTGRELVVYSWCNHTPHAVSRKTTTITDVFVMSNLELHALL